LNVPRIDPTARVADGARLADDVEVGPYCIIGPQVELRAGVRLLSHVNVAGVTVIGERTQIYPFASIGTPPQSMHYRGEPTQLVVGSDCQIREGVTLNTGTKGGGGITSIGDRCFLMVNSHVAHDCKVGNDVTFANGVVLGGHVSIGDRVFLGGQAALHQFRRIGEGAMIGGLTGITKNLIPFGFAFGPRAELVGLNTVGLKRRGCTRDDLHRLRRAYQALFLGDGVFRERLARVEAEFAGDPFVEKIIAFVREPGPLMTPAGGAEAEADSGP
jgi:UDP-N-acetylglucosamine acyltransferase